MRQVMDMRTNNRYRNNDVLKSGQWMQYLMEWKLTYRRPTVFIYFLTC